jgi:hypothetical protein
MSECRHGYRTSVESCVTCERDQAEARLEAAQEHVDLAWDRNHDLNAALLHVQHERDQAVADLAASRAGIAELRAASEPVAVWMRARLDALEGALAAPDRAIVYKVNDVALTTGEMRTFLAALARETGR